MKTEWRIFLTALSFYTRIPVQLRSGDIELNLKESIRYFPIIGWISGILSALFLSFVYMFMSPALAVIFAIISSIILTGALHEDGLADVCDAFGGGWTREKILEIMKDSRMGTYGAVGLIFVLSVKFYALSQLVSGLLIPEGDSVILLFLFLIIGQSLSRFAATTMVFTHSYVRTAGSKSSLVVQGTRLLSLYIATIITAIPLGILAYFTDNLSWLLVVVPAISVRLILAPYFKKWIGGYTGDCLGTIQQLSEVVIYLSFIIIWKYF